MLRSVACHLTLDVREPLEMLLAVAVADGPYERSEQMLVRTDDEPLDVTEIKGPTGTRVHRVLAPAGRVVVDYQATVTGQAGPAPVEDLDLVEYRRPSRYADSDRLLAFARDQFRGLAGAELLDAVVEWVARHVTYLSGSSLPTDGATDTLLKRRGVCRDFAHLVVAMLRALDVPARLAAVYAPGLRPMDFHAVAEAYVEGAWHVVDATRLAPRPTMLRIATGRDATDTAFLSYYGGSLRLRTMTVTAVTDARVQDDGTGLVALR
ncbi:MULTISPECIES: transglutaminase-like domain-containing protein [Cellulomonas]|uniref:Transglutaminase-like protein n=1 Tax=Cellulomonas oligotrophica TaxID=931536 RepID=A0A7Y9JVW3_9CELL|nr:MULTISPECIES: transglutaminase-like domain-containing protein [Cellulomonas]NYD85053.1 transglutaminase-like putative cysteine protease [Cellulomonas oligotrophica]TQL03847.1 transglutaminase superfamily protein [Cellulomonas sp. SLBN-39]GIG33758.1 putative transglutaminase-like protein [Cellulomonas oligotrophica]